MIGLVFSNEVRIVVQQGLGLDVDGVRSAEALDPVVEGTPASAAALRLRELPTVASLQPCYSSCFFSLAFLTASFLQERDPIPWPPC